MNYPRENETLEAYIKRIGGAEFYELFSWYKPDTGVYLKTDGNIHVFEDLNDGTLTGVKELARGPVVLSEDSTIEELRRIK